MNGVHRSPAKMPAVPKEDAATLLGEVKGLRSDVSDGLAAVRVTLTAILEELRKEKDKRQCKPPPQKEIR